MDRAVPANIFTAESILVVLRSGIFTSAISTSWARVTVPTFSVFGSPEALSSPAAFLIRKDAGGVLVMKLKLRSP